jgi:hypothetical protein
VSLNSPILNKRSRASEKFAFNIERFRVTNYSERSVWTEKCLFVAKRFTKCG